MARHKKVAEDGAEVKPNIEAIKELAVEFKKGRMVDRKLIALRQKLVSLYNEEKITEEEQELMEAILRKDRLKGAIASAHDHLLAAIESERAEGECYVKTDDAPVVHHLKKGIKCRYTFDPEYDDRKGRKDSIGRYHVYVPRIVPVNHQLTEDIVRREDRGHPVPPEAYPVPKTRIHRITIKTSEFAQWFEVEDDELLKASKKEETYTF